VANAVHMALHFHSEHFITPENQLESRQGSQPEEEKIARDAKFEAMKAKMAATEKMCKILATLF